MREFFKNITEAFEEIGKDVQKIGNYLYSVLFGELFDIWKMIVLIAITLIVEYIICYDMFHSWAYYGQKFGYYWIIKNIIIVPIILYITVMMKRLRVGIEEIAAGNTNYKVDTAGMYGNLRDWAENLNNISDGMNTAIEQRVKSERMKTELITNVSHDLKTPLTSIVNYANLIGQEKCDNEKIMDYSEVLVRQSVKMKRLIDDLVEASKASTGNLEVNLEPCEAEILLTQAAGEYEQKLADAGLELKVKYPETSVKIMADSRRLWRVFDNLLNNICKYGQSGTRVYLSLNETEKQVVFTFKNTSKTELNISADELMERFTRGDASRNTEGNGLGLSIAKSLTELQNGTLEILIDGDLFKVVLKFPKMI